MSAIQMIPLYTMSMDFSNILILAVYTFYKFLSLLFDTHVRLKYLFTKSLRTLRVDEITSGNTAKRILVSKSLLFTRLERGAARSTLFARAKTVAGRIDLPWLNGARRSLKEKSMSRF